MLAEERFHKIMHIIEQEGSVTVSQLMRELGASESTIRRDLNTLDENGMVTKVFGGAVAKKGTIRTEDEALSGRKLLHAEEKKEIGRYAASLVTSEDFVYLDAGSTTEMMIDYLDCPRAVFVTNSFANAQKLAGRGYQVMVLGGEYKAATEAVVGDIAVEALQKYNFTKGFWGTNGITVTNGFTTPESREAMVKHKSMKHCKERYILADASKFSQISSIRFAGFADATIITTRLEQKSFRKYQNVWEVS